MTRFSMVSAAALGLLSILVFAAFPAGAHHPPGPAPPPEPDPTLRSLFIVAAAPEAKSNSSAAPQPYCCGKYQEAGLALSEDPNQTETPSRGYTLTTEPISYVCTQGRPCNPVPVKGIAPVLSEDFQVVPEESYEGFLHLAYSFRSNVPPSLPGSSDSVGHIYIDLLLDGETYPGTGVSLKRSGGDLRIPMSFARGPCYDDNNTKVECAPLAEAHPEVWTHDLMLQISIMGGYSGIWDQTFGSQLVVKLDTNGGSALLVHEVVPPPPVDVADDDGVVAADGGDAEAIEIVAEDTDGDGEPEFALAPGPSPILIVAALALGLGLARRLFG